MIFVTVGSQKFPFDRLLKSVDELIEKGVITETVFAQTGCCEYIPKNYPYKAFLNRDEFADYQEQADIVITHGGTGAIIGAVKKGKKVIAVPRRAQYGEHVDDHQLQLIGQFKEQNLILGLSGCEEVEDALRNIRQMEFASYESNTLRYLDRIEAFINKLSCGA